MLLFLFLCCIPLSTKSLKFTPLSYPLPHLFGITSAVLRRCFVASAMLRRCFCVASALPSRFFDVALAFFRRSLGCGVASAACAATSVQLRCNFGSILAQQCVGLDQDLTAGCSDAHLCDLGVACSLHDQELLKALNTFRFFKHERHNNTCFEVYLAVQFSFNIANFNFNIAVTEIPIPERTRMGSKARQCVSKLFAEWENISN